MIVAVETHRNRSVGTLLRCAAAFGASEFAVVGSTQYGTHGAHGAQLHYTVTHFYYWDECIEFCKTQGASIYSISPFAISATQASESSSESSAVACKSSVSIDEFVFDSPACFIVGSKEGLTEEIISKSDIIFHVEVPMAGLDHLVHYDAKVSLVLQRYATCMSFPPRSFAEEKHILGAIEHNKPHVMRAAVRLRATESGVAPETGLSCEGFADCQQGLGSSGLGLFISEQNNGDCCGAGDY